MAAAPALEHADRYPHELVDRMKRLGLFGALVPTDYGGLGLDVTTYAQIIEELCRGFMSLAGVINSHTMAALIVLEHGTDEQRLRLLPALRERAGPRRPLPHRAPRRLGRAGHPHGGPARGRPVPALRLQDVRDQRPRGQHLRAARPDRPRRVTPSPRHVLLHRREGRPRPRGGQVHRQARLQGRGHRGAGVRRLPLPGREPGGRRGGPRLQARHVRARGRADQHRGARGGGRPGRPRRGGARRARPAGAARRPRGHRHAGGVGPARHLLGRRP